MTVEAIIQRFGGFDAYALLGSKDVNNPRNAMTIAPVARCMVRSLNLWLTPFKVGHLAPTPRFISFPLQLYCSIAGK